MTCGGGRCNATFYSVVTAFMRSVSSGPQQNTWQRKSHFYIPFLGIARPHPNFHLHVSVSDLYIPRIGPHIFLQQNMQIDRGEYINRLQTHECGNWDCGQAIPFLGIFVSNFRYCFFAVQAGITLITARVWEKGVQIYEIYSKALSFPSDRSSKCSTIPQ
jgi:hypothetical protein